MKSPASRAPALTSSPIPFVRHSPMATLSQWLHAARPRTLPAAVVPVALGSACAHAAGSFRAVPALLALAFALLVQVACNLANDYFDFRKGADTAERIGPARATASGWVTPAAMRRAVIGVCALAFLVGLGLLPFGGWPLLIVGVASILAALAYTAGPFPLAYNGLGDVFVVGFFGFVAVPFTAYVQCGYFPAAVWPVALGCGLLADGILIVNNARDRETDAKAGKRTTAVLFGLGFAKAHYALTLLVGLGTPLVLLLPPFNLRWPVLAALVVCPFAGPVVRAFCAASQPREFAPLLGRTAGILLAWGLLLALGVVFAG